MKVTNQLVGIKVGNKQYNFTNLILDSYLRLFAQSFVKFVDKDLDYCFINCTKTNNVSTSSTEMNYDLVLEAKFQDIIEELSPTTIINKYYYKDEFLGQSGRWDDVKGQTIKEIGFGKYDEKYGTYYLYAYINVSDYNIVVQDSQPIIISRIDKIVSDMMLYTNNSQKVKAPYHLSMRGILEYSGNEYIQTVPKLYSLGFANEPSNIIKEYVRDTLSMTTGGTEINFLNDFEAYYNNSPFYNYLVYKFKLYKITYPDIDKVEYVDTGMFYNQYLKLNKHGKLGLSVKYERS